LYSSTILFGYQRKRCVFFCLAGSTFTATSKHFILCSPTCSKNFTNFSLFLFFWDSSSSSGCFLYHIQVVAGCLVIHGYFLPLASSTTRSGQEVLGLYTTECKIVVSAMEVHRYGNGFFLFSKSPNTSKSYVGKLVVVLSILPTNWHWPYQKGTVVDMVPLL